MSIDRIRLNSILRAIAAEDIRIRSGSSESADTQKSEGEKEDE